MKRNIDIFLRKWVKSKTRKPLIIRGARQVGKTFSVDALSVEFSHYIKVDFEETPSLKTLFKGDLDVLKITQELCALHGKKFDPQKTLLFLDEIQECPEAIKALRYFYEKLPELTVVAAGSLLEFSIGEFSFPVGRVSFYWMFPMTFMEYLSAKGDDVLISHIPTLDATEAIPDLIHKKLLERLKEYYIVGGMPEAVQTFIQTNSYTAVADIQRSIILSYVEDVSRHHMRIEKQFVTELFYSLAKSIGKQVKYTSLLPGNRVEKIKSMVQKFQKILVVHPVYSSNGEYPFKTSADQKIFKMVFLDIGLMQNMCGIQYEELLIKGDLMASYEGALAEQFVGQQIVAQNPQTPPELYYWNRKKQGGQAEIDYLLENRPATLVEVKSDKAGRLRSMHQALKAFDQVPFGVVLSMQNISILKEQRLKFLPLYTSLA